MKIALSVAETVKILKLEHGIWDHFDLLAYWGQIGQYWQTSSDNIHQQSVNPM